MPCNLLVYDTEARTKTTYVCDEANTERFVEDDYEAKGTGEYVDVDGAGFAVDWTRCRLIGFTRRSGDGNLIASGGADGSQTDAPV